MRPLNGFASQPGESCKILKLHIVCFSPVFRVTGWTRSAATLFANSSITFFLRAYLLKYAAFGVLFISFDHRNGDIELSMEEDMDGSWKENRRRKSTHMLPSTSLLPSWVQRTQEDSKLVLGGIELPGTRMSQLQQKTGRLKVSLAPMSSKIFSLNYCTSPSHR